MNFSFNDIHNIRLFPKRFGTSAYKITGISAKCDWKVISDIDGSACLFDSNIIKPQTVFISLRAGIKALEYFGKEVLPRISNPFV